MRSLIPAVRLRIATAALALLLAGDAGADMLLMGAGANSGGGGGGGYVQPAPTQVIFLGDSRTENGAGASISSNALTVSTTTTNGYPGWLGVVTDNAFLSPDSFGYGVGGQTSWGILGRLQSISTETDSVVKNRTSGDPAYLSFDTPSDQLFNRAGLGVYSAYSDPGNVVAILGPMTNDPSYLVNTAQTFTGIAAVLDALGPSGANKIVLLGNEIPRGVETLILENHGVSGFATTVTPAFSGQFTTDVELYNQAGTLYTKVGSAPAVGQYTVAIVGATGVYAFNAADTITTAYISYHATGAQARTGAGLAWHVDAHGWLGSSASNYTGLSSGTNFGIPGALYARPWVIGVDTWSALIDNTSGANFYNLPFTLADGLHPQKYGGRLIAAAFAPALTTLFPGGSQARLPTDILQNNMGTFTGTTASGTGNVTVIGSTFTPKISVGATVTDSSARFSVPTTVLSVGATSMVLSTNASASGSGDTFTVKNDVLNLLKNGMMDPLYAGAAKPTNVTGAGVLPNGWTMSVDAGTATALAPTATLVITITNGTDSGGFPTVDFNIDGFSAAAPNITFAQTIANFATLATPGEKYRAAAHIEVAAGTNGHLAGLQGVKMSALISSSPAFTRQGPTATGAPIATLTSASGAAFSGGSLIDFSDIDLTLGGVYSIVTPPIDTTGMTFSGSQSLTFSLVCEGSKPIHAKISISRVAFRKFTASLEPPANDNVTTMSTALAA